MYQRSVPSTRYYGILISITNVMQGERKAEAQLQRDGNFVGIKMLTYMFIRNCYAVTSQ